MRAGLILAALALSLAAPLAAQEPAATATVPAAAPASPPAPGPIVLVSGPDALLAQFGTASVDAAASLCLMPDETAVLASDRTTFMLSGGSCHQVAAAEQEAYAAEQEANFAHELAAAQAAHEAARASGNEAAISRTDLALKLARLKIGRKPVGAAMGGALPFERSSPIIFRLAGASSSVLGRYPRGTIVQRTTSLCLQNGEQATINGSNGQSVTYTGPGCLRRKARPTGDNLGGFTFG